jgi:2-hydroxycyclohexanecarboxyl-CoA dehydrogenase
MGEATCHELGRRGHKVAVLDLDSEAAQRVSEELRAEGVTALAVAADVSDRAAVEEAFAKIRTELGPVHILVTARAWWISRGSPTSRRRPGSG